MGRDNQNSKKWPVKLKEIALSTENTSSERLRAIDLLGHLNVYVYDDLADIAAKGLTRIERINALEILAIVSRRIGSEQTNVDSIQREKNRKSATPLKPKNIKPEKAEETVEFKNDSNSDIPEELFEDMLSHVKQLLTPEIGCSESEIKNQFRNLKGTLVETFLAAAIQKGLVKEITSGMFKLIVTD